MERVNKYNITIVSKELFYDIKVNKIEESSD